MFDPIDSSKYLKKNYQLMFEDYTFFSFLVSFIILPMTLTGIVVFFIDSCSLLEIINDSINFFSIIVGFLINVLVLLLSSSKFSGDTNSKKILIEKLKMNLSFNILNSILFGTVLIILILFIGNYNFENPSFLCILEWIIMSLFFHFIMLLFNILRKFGTYVESRFR